MSLVASSVKMILVLFFIIGVVSGGKFPDGVKLCHRSDPNFQKCVAKNMQDSLKYFANGYKELGLPKLEPLFIEELEINGDPGNSVSISQKYRNVQIYGSINSTFDKYFHIELDKGCKWSFDGFSPIIRMEADYEIKGQLLLIPINSQGKCNITQINLTNRHTMICEKYTKNNDTYIRIVNYTMDMSLEKISFDFDNIFEGNDQISNEISKTLNENSLTIYNELKGGIEKAVSSLYFALTNSVFSRVPLREIFLD